MGLLCGKGVFIYTEKGVAVFRWCEARAWTAWGGLDRVTTVGRRAVSLWQATQLRSRGVVARDG